MKSQITATWTARQEQFALLISSGRSIVDAAAQVGAAERTAHSWLENPSFRTFVAELRRRLLDQASGRLIDTATEAADALRELLREGHPPAIRLGAARAILESLIRIRFPRPIGAAGPIDRAERTPGDFHPHHRGLITTLAGEGWE
jgi:hypothetical protein